MEMNNYSAYCDVLKELIPEIKKQEKTLMEIAGFPHYENVISNILQFFMSPDEEHNFQQLFLQSLLICISRKRSIKVDSTFSFVVEREYPGLEQTRIDLLISPNKNEDNTIEWAIIIECKIWASLYNNLDHYWNALNAKNKIGVILSLHPIQNIAHAGFANITLEEYCKEIMNCLGQYVLNASDKYLIFLKDFINNILSLKPNRNMLDYLEFYYKHSEKINKLAMMRDQVSQLILDRIVDCGRQLGYKVANTRAEFYRCWLLQERNDIYFTLLTHTANAESNNQLMLILEIKQELLKDKNKFTTDAVLQEIARKNDIQIGEIHSDGNYMHIMNKTIELNADWVTNMEENLINLNSKILVHISKRVDELLNI